MLFVGRVSGRDRIKVLLPTPRRWRLIRLPPSSCLHHFLKMFTLIAWCSHASDVTARLVLNLKKNRFLFVFSVTLFPSSIPDQTDNHRSTWEKGWKSAGLCVETWIHLLLCFIILEEKLIHGGGCFKEVSCDQFWISLLHQEALIWCRY